jgi:hypothetical protein
MCVPSLVEIAPGIPELCPDIHTHTHTYTQTSIFIGINWEDGHMVTIAPHPEGGTSHDKVRLLLTLIKNLALHRYLARRA